MHSRIGLFALAALLGACAGSSNAGRDSTGAPAEAVVTVDSMRVLTELQSSGWSDREIVVVENTADFRRAWDRVHANAGEAPPLPSVVFARERVVVVGAGTRSSGGYVMMPGTVRMTGDTLVVEVILQTPGAQCGTTAALTEPVIVLALRRTTAVPRVTMTERPGPSC